MTNVGFLSTVTALAGPMGYPSSTAPDELRIMNTVAVSAVGLLAVFVVFVNYFHWLPAVIEIGVIVAILLVARASKRWFENLVIGLMSVNLLVALFVLTDHSGPLPAVKGIGITILILLAVAWLISRIWKNW